MISIVACVLRLNCDVLSFPFWILHPGYTPRWAKPCQNLGPFPLPKLTWTSIVPCCPVSSHLILWFLAILALEKRR
jgi:hypothetical protein